MKKRVHSRGKVLRICLSMTFGLLLGVALNSFLSWQLSEGGSYGENMRRRMALVVFLLCAFRLNTLIHETGHLVFGLASGYRFVSFRIGSFVILKQNGKLICRRFRIPGTGGQCLMAPPEMKDGKFPVFAYNMGGSFLNVISSAVFLTVFLLTDKRGYAALFYLMMIVFGLIAALGNGIPLRSETVDNDGYNALSLGKNPEALSAVWIQLKVTQQYADGKRLSDMPDAWFHFPADDLMSNSLICAVAVYACNRLMDQHRFEEARQRMEHLLRIDSRMMAFHRNMLTADLLYLELIGGNRAEVLAQLYTPELKRILRKSKTSPGVIRLEYAYALLAEKDTWKARLALERFERAARCHPYPGDIHSEREFLEIAAKCAAEQKIQVTALKESIGDGERI